MDRVSSAGYALGYLGGGLLLALNLAMIQKPALFGLSGAQAATQLSFVTVGLWWVLFTIPLLLRVPEPPRKLEPDERPGQNPLVVTFVRLGETLKELRGYKQAFMMLLAFMIYNDGISTIIRMATTYGAEIGLDQGHMIQALLLVQFVGIPFAFLFGALAGKIGAKRSIFFALAVYTGISVLAYRMQTSSEFYLLAILVGMVQGGSQALSRSMFAAMIPKHKSSEFFGFFGVFEKFAGVAGPALFALAVYGTGSSRLAILSVTLFFAVGAAILWRVDLDEGRREAAAHDQNLRPA
jgi:UMF1 family MFS transporter